MKKKYQRLLLLLCFLPLLLHAQIKPFEASALMTRGINLGNTMEAGYEGQWNAPIREHYFDDIKAAGFTTVRIPIRWYTHTNKTVPYTIDQAWLDRVEQVVDWGLARGLFIVINTHHETQLFENFDGLLPMYVSIWSQIAQRLRGKSDRLLFELLNEPHGAPTVANLNDFNYRVLRAIRPSNPNRIVVYSGNQWANSYNLINRDLRNPDPTDQYLMGYYHSYDPIGFGLDGNGSFGSDAQKLALWNKFKSVSDWTLTSRVPAFLGEFGAVSSGEINSRFRYYATVVDYAQQHSIPFMVWDNGGDFQVYQRSARKFNELKDILVHYYPQSPTNFTASQSGGVNLSWTNRASNATSILVQRKLTSSDVYTTIATLGATASSYTDNSASAGTYYYRVITVASASVQYYGYPQMITTTGGPSFAVNLVTDKTIICAGQPAILTATPLLTSGTISRVEFFEGSTLLSTDQTAPYTFLVSNPSLGNHTYVARATSSTGSAVSSSGVLVQMTSGASITPYVRLNADWLNQSSATVCAGSTVVFGPQPLTASGWTWTGPNGFTSTNREISLANLSTAQTGIYTATFDDGSGCPGVMNFSLTVNSATVAITPYVQLNGEWLNQQTAVVCPGASLQLGPQPVSEEGWTWTGPNGFTSTSREIALSNMSATNAGTYRAVYNDGSGCPSSLDFQVSLITTAPPTVASPIQYIVNAAAAPLSANGTNLLWYTSSAGGIGTSEAPTPSTNLVGITSYYVSQTVNGCESARAKLDVRVVSVNTAPTVSITSPISGTSFTSPTNITIQVNASDGDGSISKVEYYNGPTLIGSSSTSPYSFTWTNVLPGSYTLTAKATDNEGASTLSSAISITVRSSTTCILPALSTSNWAVRNNWNDHTTGGLNVSSDATSIIVNNRAWGQNYFWAITNTKYALTAGVTYTFSFDIQGNFSIARTEAGLASGIQWDGPILSQPSVVAASGYVTNSVNSKSVVIRPNSSGMYHIAIRVTMSSQATTASNFYIRNVKYCSGNTSAKTTEEDVALEENSEASNSQISELVYPNPTSNFAVVKINNGNIKDIKLVESSGVELEVPVTEHTTDSWTLDLRSIEKGFYWIRIYQHDNTSRILKLVKY
jgi:hypothetical protein